MARLKGLTQQMRDKIPHWLELTADWSNGVRYSVGQVMPHTAPKQD